MPAPLVNPRGVRMSPTPSGNTYRYRQEIPSGQDLKSLFLNGLYLASNLHFIAVSPTEKKQGRSPMSTHHNAIAHPTIETSQPVDMARLRDMVDDDPTTLRLIVDLYLAESSELMAGLRRAVRAGANADVEAIAHKLGGSSATCGMMGIVAPLRELEHSGKASKRLESGQSPNEQALLEAEHQHELIRACLAHLRTH